MALSENLGLMPWSPLAGVFLSGKFKRNIEKAGDSRRDNFDFPPLDKSKTYNIIDLMEKIGANHNVSIAQVALAWLLKKAVVTSVIIGAKKEEQLIDNINSTGLILTDDEINNLDSISTLTKEYPGWMLERQSQDRV